MKTRTPIINGTQRQYAIIAWQLARGAIDQQLTSHYGFPVAELNLGPDEPRFNAWWGTVRATPFADLRALLEAAWEEGAKLPLQPLVPNGFELLWNRIEAEQPLVGSKMREWAFTDLIRSLHPEHQGVCHEVTIITREEREGAPARVWWRCACGITGIINRPQARELASSG